jgi:hypothetical protein
MLYKKINLEHFGRNIIFPEYFLLNRAKNAISDLQSRLYKIIKSEVVHIGPRPIHIDQKPK